MRIGMTELLVLLAIVLIIFGPSQLPKLTKMIGKSVRGLRDGIKEGSDEVNKNNE